ETGGTGGLFATNGSARPSMNTTRSKGGGGSAGSTLSLQGDAARQHAGATLLLQMGIKPRAAIVGIARLSPAKARAANSPTEKAALSSAWRRPKPLGPPHGGLPAPHSGFATRSAFKVTPRRATPTPPTRRPFLKMGTPPGTVATPVLHPHRAAESSA